MARKFLVNVDLAKNEIQNAVIQVLATAPSSPVEGQVYYDSVAHKPYVYNGSAWKALDEYVAVTFGTPGSSAVGDSAVEGSASTSARSDHQHGRESFGTSASTQAVGDSAAGGSATTPSRSDHKHALPGFGSVSAQTTFGASSANGSATTIARSDHAHGTPAHDGTAHSTISVSSLSAPTGDLSLATYKITNLGTPTADTDAATKGYVDAARSGLDVKQSVRAATTVAGTLASSFENGDVIDGVTLATGDRILIKNQSSGSENGIYVVAASGAPTRATDFDTSGEVTPGSFTFVEEGTANADSGWVLTTDGAITLGTTALTFAQFSGAGQITAGDGLTKSANTLNVVAGTGISVAADSVSIDTAVVARKYATDLGDGSNTSYTVTHSLGTRDVSVQVYAAGSPYAQVECDVEHATTNTVTVKFASAPSSNAYRVIVVG